MHQFRQNFITRPCLEENRIIRVSLCFLLGSLRSVHRWVLVADVCAQVCWLGFPVVGSGLLCIVSFGLFFTEWGLLVALWLSWVGVCVLGGWRWNWGFACDKQMLFHWAVALVLAPIWPSFIWTGLLFAFHGLGIFGECIMHLCGGYSRRETCLPVYPSRGSAVTLLSLLTMLSLFLPCALGKRQCKTDRVLASLGSPSAFHYRHGTRLPPLYYSGRYRCTIFSCLANRKNLWFPARLPLSARIRSENNRRI